MKRLWYHKNREKILEQKRLKYKEGGSKERSIVEKEKERERHLKRVYGISLAQFNTLLEKQENKCYICHRTPNELNRNLCVDHDHKTGEIRGLLCVHCNQRIIGRTNSAEIFERAAQYLTGPFSGWFVPKKKKKTRTRKNSNEIIKLLDNEDLKNENN